MSQIRSDDQHDLRDEYDFSGGVRGKHHEAYRKGTNVVLLDPDVAEVDIKRERRAAACSGEQIGDDAIPKTARVLGVNDLKS